MLEPAAHLDPVAQGSVPEPECGGAVDRRRCRRRTRWRCRRRRSSSSRAFPAAGASSVPPRPRRCCGSTRGSSPSSRSSPSNTRRTTRRAPTSRRACGTRVFDLVKAFAAAYGAVLRAGYPRADHKRWQRAAAVDSGSPRPLSGHRRQVPAVPLRHVDPRAMARISRALRIRADARLAARTSSRTAPACSRGRACASSRNT